MSQGMNIRKTSSRGLTRFFLAAAQRGTKIHVDDFETSPNVLWSSKLKFTLYVNPPKSFPYNVSQTVYFSLFMLP